MENVDSILAFLDHAEKTENHRKIPTSAELKKKTDLKEKKLQKQIQIVKNQIDELVQMKQDIPKEKEKYHFSIMKIQASIDRVIREKEVVSAKIENLSFQLSELNRVNQNFNVQEQVSEKVKQSIDDAIKPLKLKLSSNIRRITLDSARQAQMEFAPHINQLKSDHSAEILKIRTAMNKEIEEIKQNAQNLLNSEISSFRTQFYNQTEKQIAIIDKQNASSIESLRKKNERERLRYEKDIDNIYISIENDVKEIKNRYQREYDRERSKMLRLIDDCRNDLKFAKARAESQIKHFDEIAQKNEIFYNQLSEAEIDLSFESSNQQYISSKTKEMKEELDDFKERLEAETQKNINSKEIDLKRQIKITEDDIGFFKKEIERISNIKDKEINFRQRQEKRTLSSKNDLSLLLNSISSLSDQIHGLKSELLTLSSTNKTENSINMTKHNEECMKINDKINEVKIQRKKLAQLHQNEMNTLQTKHKSTISNTSARVKSIIEAKDAQIAQLQEQYLNENAKIESLSKALHSK